jgi:hypothetical protein
MTSRFDLCRSLRIKFCSCPRADEVYSLFRGKSASRPYAVETRVGIVRQVCAHHTTNDSATSSRSSTALRMPPLVDNAIIAPWSLLANYIDKKVRLCGKYAFCHIVDLCGVLTDHPLSLVSLPRMYSYDIHTNLLLLVHYPHSILVDMSLCLDPTGGPLSFLAQSKCTVQIIGYVERIFVCYTFLTVLGIKLTTARCTGPIGAASTTSIC